MQPAAHCPGYTTEFIQEKTGLSCPIVETARSSQQQVFIVHVDRCCDPNCWKKELHNGGNRLVVRVWNGASRWWNLNHPQNKALELKQIARQEVWGYQTSRSILLQTSSPLCIPRVIHSSLQEPPYWAILEYIGPGSVDFRDDVAIVDSSWINGMTKIRDEFGFPEPHPRWGRVPVEQAVDYALQVLHSVVIPLHTGNTTGVARDTSPSTAHTYESMVRLYHHEFHAFLAVYAGNHNDDDKLTKLQTVIRVVRAATQQLKHTCDVGAIPAPLPPKLCHMDLQPQNIVFGKKGRVSKLTAVFDWEEAACADPRFELLMLGRKVCANRSQALEVWNTYEELVQINLGPIDPWLQLETLHSLITLLLQATSGGGRSPWESKPDLWGKIDREMSRLQRP